MQLNQIIIHLVALVGSLWIVERGIKGITHRQLQINLRVYEREYLNASAFVLGLAYTVLGAAAVILTVLSVFQTDYRLLQLVGVFWVALIMITIFANWFAHDP